MSRLKHYVEEFGEATLFELLKNYGVEYTAKRVLGYKTGVSLRNQMKKNGLWKKWKSIEHSVVLIIVFSLILSITSAQSIYYTYQGNTTDKLFVGGEVHFPKEIADRIKVSGGVVSQNEKEWIIKVTASSVQIEYIKLTDDSFSYGKKSYRAEEYPAELYKPVKPDELRITIKDLYSKINYQNQTLNTIKLQTKALVDKPTFSEQLAGFFIYNPFMIVIYLILAFFALLGVVGKIWG